MFQRVVTLLLLQVSVLSFSFTPAPDLFSQSQHLPESVYMREPTSQIKSKWELIPQASVISPTSVHLIDSDYEIPYSQVLSGFPAVHFTLASPFKKFGDVQTYALIRGGFSYKSGNYRVPAKTHDLAQTSLNLLWVPLSIGTKIQYIVPGFPFVRPALNFGLGAEYLKQNSSLSELNASVWLPYYYITPQIGFFEGAGDTWFNGFSFGVSFINSFGFDKRVQAWSYDLSLNIAL